MTFTREISFTPAYDRRTETPNYGQHYMHMAFVLKADKGALVFDIATGWYIDYKAYPTEPHVWGLVAHRHLESNPHSDDIEESCGWLDDQPCVDESLFGLTSPEHDRLFSIFLTQGADALWTELETIYAERM